MAKAAKKMYQHSTFFVVDGLAWRSDHHARSPRPAGRSGFAAWSLVEGLVIAKVLFLVARALDVAATAAVQMGASVIAPFPLPSRATSAGLSCSGW